MEPDGVNHLLPVDARLEHDTDVRYKRATLDDVLAATTGASLQEVIPQVVVEGQPRRRGRLR